MNKKEGEREEKEHFYLQDFICLFLERGKGRETLM